MWRRDRLWGAPSPSGRWLGWALALALFCGRVGAADDPWEWLSRSRQIMESAPEEARPPWLPVTPSADALRWAREIAEPTHPGAAGPPNAPSGRVLIFASLSVPAVTLRELLKEAQSSDTVVILRGIPRGTNIQGAIERLRRLAPQTGAAPNVIIDPIAFQRYEVSAVPTLVLIREGSRAPVIARGAVTVSWLRRMSATVAPGSEDLGRRAETYEIEEPDFVLEMQRRLAGIDWEAQRAGAMGRFWAKHKDFVALPDARHHREFLVNPTVELTDDLEDAQGHTVARAGERWNPLDWMVLSKTIVVFRGTDPRQVTAVKAVIRSAEKAGHGVILLTTDIDADHGWEHLGKLENTLSGTVYLLPQSLVDRFHLQAVPSTIVSQGRQLLVTELDPGGDS
jgi:conjugal transfer pilus assembly protein TraW